VIFDGWVPLALTSPVFDSVEKTLSELSRDAAASDGFEPAENLALQTASISTLAKGRKDGAAFFAELDTSRSTHSVTRGL
jgi:hypothetical protein